LKDVEEAVFNELTAQEKEKAIEHLYGENYDPPDSLAEFAGERREQLWRSARKKVTKEEIYQPCA
jgi:hypothetical protein